MKNKLILLVCVFVLGLTYTQASFPVNKEKAQEAIAAVQESDLNIQSSDVQTDITVIETDSEAISPASAAGYDKWVAAALWFVLGAFAAHRWYAKKPTGWNILFILTLGGLGIWAIVDIVNILTDNFQ